MYNQLYHYIYARTTKQVGLGLGLGLTLRFSYMYQRVELNQRSIPHYKQDLLHQPFRVPGHQQDWHYLSPPGPNVMTVDACEDCLFLQQCLRCVFWRSVCYLGGWWLDCRKELQGTIISFRYEMKRSGERMCKFHTFKIRFCKLLCPCPWV